MKVIDILNSEECKPLFEEVQKFVQISLSEYNKAIEKSGFSYTDKDIFDFVWGTVEFSAAEICILDSPLLQRLRRIKQLGLASTVYCNADNSRFSHTIGVTEVASRMARMVTRRLDNSAYGPEEFDAEEIVRIAAIFHDTGHMFFSHVSELYFAYDKSFPRYKEITRALTHFSTAASAEVALHELISVMIVNSPETMKLFQLISPYMKKSRLTKRKHFEQLAEYISCLIIGIPNNKFILPYSGIINSAIDADKLDYLSRDSACTKVPIAVDIARIVQKLDVVNIKEIEYPAIWNDQTSEAWPLKIMAIKNSAKSVFWQLSNARSSMYESVYYHHKVLTAETMFREALRKLFMIKDETEINFSEIMQLTDDVFNEYWDRVLVNESEKDERIIDDISDIFRCVRERQLMKRAASFSQDKFIGSVARSGAFISDVVQNPLSVMHEDFLRHIAEEYVRIHEVLGDDEEKEDNPRFIFIYSKYHAMASVPVESGDGFCVWSSMLMKQETMEAGRRSKQEQFYLLTNCKDRDTVFLAFEKALAKYMMLQLPKEASICSKVSYEMINEKRHRLLEKGYYKDVLYILKDDIFMSLLDKRQFKAILEKYGSFSGVSNCKITEKSLREYLRQFLYLQIETNELKVLLSGVMSLLEKAYYLDRESATREFTYLFRKIAEMKCPQKYVILLGGRKDSANHLAYYLNDVEKDDSITLADNLSGTLKECTDEDCICFLDDGAYSGKQVISIFQEYMGIDKENRTTNEHHVDELTDAEKERLKSIRVVLTYLCFNSKSEKYVKEEFAKIGLTNIDICYIKDLSQKVFDNIPPYFSSKNQCDITQKHLKQIGEDVLMSTKKLPAGDFKSRWSKERIEEGALGYNDAQQCVVFSTNIPTYSLTALWANGEFAGNEWRGLFQRTVKD